MYTVGIRNRTTTTLRIPSFEGKNIQGHQVHYLSEYQNYGWCLTLGLVLHDCRVHLIQRVGGGVDPFKMLKLFILANSFGPWTVRQLGIK